MDNEYIREQLIEILCKDYQTVWLINLDDYTMEVFNVDRTKIIPGSVDTVKEINSYEDARLWYIDNCVAENSKEKLLRQTSINYILEQLEDGTPFYVEYSRVRDSKINFNQICYDKICDEKTGTPKFIVQGFRNIDVAKKAELDDQTGALTRRAFFKKAEEKLARYPDEQYDLIIYDIVDFKKINETYGSDVADEILKWMGKYLLSTCEEHVILGRYGGDQLVKFGPRDKIMNSLSISARAAFYANEKENDLPPIKVKCGVYLDVKHHRSIISTCDKAHMALSSIKHQYNKDIAYYNDEIRTHLEKQRRIEDSMYESLKNGDFKVYYQPKHEAKTGKLVGAEALVRWIHPEYGFMSPGDFIPLFEQNGFIVENDYFVWNKTCENIRKWEDRGIKTVPVSVNGSKLTMANTELIDILKGSVEKYNLDPSQLHLEITETLMEDTTDEMVEKLKTIREMGFKVELDDFGSGYSSLNVLSTLPIDIVKLDMSFMQQFGDEKRSLVLESCIDLAKKLGFETVSEGVEIKEQQEFLGQLGVDMIQGYYYSKPLSEREFEMYLLEHVE